MLNAGPQGGWGANATAAPPNRKSHGFPFIDDEPQPFDLLREDISISDKHHYPRPWVTEPPYFRHNEHQAQITTALFDINSTHFGPFNAAMPPPPGNPFAKPPSNPFLGKNNSNAQAPTNNPFAASTTTANPFSAASTTSLKRSVSPSFKQPTKSAVSSRNPFESAKQEVLGLGIQLPKPSTTIHRSSPGPIANGSRKVAAFVQPAWPNESNTSTTPVLNSANSKKRTGGINAQGSEQNGRSAPAPTGMVGKRSLAAEFGLNAQNIVPHRLPNHSPNQHDGRSHELASKIQQQLSRDRIQPPQWPVNPGSHAQRQAMEIFRESYKSYREKARKSLIRAGLIDDPDQKRTLRQALDFRGISEEMCPEWEKITRITEYDVRNPEKAPDDSGDLVAIPSLMVKRLARSAAGQDAPLPMDVRSFATLRKTLDYLIDDLIPDDSLLPSKHNFLWDRTRAIRIDLSVQKYNLTPDERTDLIYCLETIARFHVTALHLLSQDGFAAEDFSEQQEIEQLGKTLISLKELYDDCAQQEIECPNEAEFRGYYIVFNARNPSIKETVEGWSTRLWNSDGIRTAMCLVESLQNTWTLQGPLNPYAPTEVALGAAAIFFSMVSSPQISYTMACFAEIHFNDVRKSMLHILRKSYTRPRDGPKDITPAFLKERMRFDAEEEAVDFAQKHGIVFGQDGVHRYAILNSRQSIEDPRIRHAFSQDIVERKRSGRSLPDIIHQTIYQDRKGEVPIASQGESLFVADVANTSSDTSDSLAQDSETDSFDSMIPSSPPVTMNTQSPNNKTADYVQPQAAISSSSHISQFAPTSKLPTTTTPLFATPTPTPSSNHQTPSSLFKQPHASPFGLNSDTIIRSDERSQLNANTSTLGQNGKGGATSENGKYMTSNNTGSPSTFSFLSPDNKGSSTPPLSASTKPPLFSSIDVGGNSPKATTTKPVTTALSNPQPSSSTPTYPQSHDISSNWPAFQQAPSTAIPSNTVSVLGPNFPTFSPKLNPSVSSTTQYTNSNKPEPSTGMVSTLPRSEPEKTNHVQRAPYVTAPTSMVPKKDPMGDFTQWFVLADKGLMKEELEALAVEHVLRTTWENFKAAEEDRLRREEDEKSWEEALKFRHYSLKITFFYRWRDITRKRRVIKRIQLEKEKARKWNSSRSKTEREAAEGARREKAIQEARELVGKRTKKHAQELARMRESTQSHRSLEQALLATGVFSGVQNECAAARHAARDDDVDSEGGMFPAEKLRLRSENQRRRKRGLPPLKRFPEAKAYKEGSKTAMLRAISSGAGRDSLSMSTGSVRNSTFSSSYRSSLGFNQSRVAKSRPNISDPYWRMKANGLVQMPNGEYLHETLALPMLREGKRFPGLGDYGLPPEDSFTPSQSPPVGLNLDPASVSPTPARFLESNRASRSPSIIDGVTQKRKRGQAEDEDLAAYRNEVPASRKRAKSNDRATPTTPSADQDFLDSIASLLNKVNAVTKS
ncbi:hypothetical protein E0Z10_g7626 [Xylaria hypoxylon]|uniref:SAC3/GANP/THP3 conserved domain-containing protein n=1 Tax=Xylaria hypoxylon TaxID=37992 RepID=A0A4Z0YA96_9PEZI|nr:hypothetical protein E0Z10_g7626 [Xylaria hypoxylon]